MPGFGVYITNKALGNKNTIYNFHYLLVFLSQMKKEKEKGTEKWKWKEKEKGKEYV